MEGINRENVLTKRNISGRLAFHRSELNETTIGGNLVTIFTMFDVVMIFVICVVLAWIKDVKIDRERMPVFLPIRPPKGFRLYAVLLETGQSPAGGTTSRIFLRLCGILTKSPAFTLVCTSKMRKDGSKKLFGSQNKDIFILSLPHYLGKIVAFEVMTDRRGESPPWFLHSIRVMCLNNRKCWKSNVGTWLRGDMKPYCIKAALIGALSTQDYLIKIFFQNHSWLYTWFRSLGSSFTCKQRCSIHWTSMGIALGLSHYMLYDEGIVENLRTGKLTTPNFSGADIVKAGVVSSGVGVFIGMLLRLFIRGAAGGARWARVDDKDDFSHMMGKRDLYFANGAVVKLGDNPFNDCLRQLKLTRQQRRAIKHITECGVTDCNLKTQLNHPICREEQDCCYSEVGYNGEYKSNNESDKSGKNTPTVLWKDQNTNENSQKVKQKFGNVLKRFWGAPSPSHGSKKVTRKSFRSIKNQIPSVSARVTSGSESDKPSSKRSGQSKVSTKILPTSVEYNSLSEEESDQELVTKSARTDSEICLTRRPEHVYEIAPKWHDQYRVWVQASIGGEEHHKALNNRYKVTELKDLCCLKVGSKPDNNDLAAFYQIEEENAMPGGINQTTRSVANLISGFGAFIGIAAVGYAIYQRLKLPDAETLVYLYAVLLILVLQSIVFSTMDATFWAMMATWNRRRRILRRRMKNARRLKRKLDAYDG